MAKGIARLRAVDIKNAKGPSKLCDGGGLWLFVTESGSKNWVFRYRLHGRDREMGLGPAHDVGLAEARDRAKECRNLKRTGIDPIRHRDEQQLQARLEAARNVSFNDCVDAYIKAHGQGWKNEKHAAQWRNTLDTYAGPIFGKLPVQEVDTGLVLKALEAIWYEKAETASRVRQRIEAVLDWAAVRGYRQGDNPARWKGHLDKLLPKPTRVKKVQHHPALPYSELGEFMAELRGMEGTPARTLEFTILTAARTNEVLMAQWDEIDLEGKVWTVPAERMKSKRDHRVPLSEPAVRLLKALEKTKTSDYVFPGRLHQRPQSNMTMLKLLQQHMGRTGITVHGFRSTFRDWCAEQTNFPRELAEAALAHVLSDKTEAAYQRGDLFEKRRRLMRAWAKFCDTGRLGT